VLPASRVRAGNAAGSLPGDARPQARDGPDRARAWGRSAAGSLGGRRAGRSERSAAAVLIARDDPLDTYLVRHPEILLRHPVEATVLDPGNPYVLGPHLCAAAAELAVTEQDLEIFGPAARTVVDELTRTGRLRRRAAGWYGMRRDAAAAVRLRGAGLAPVRVVEEATGRLVGTVDEPSAHLIVHEGAVYVR
jgi:DEAD/DEAH box helicase domain-containing protein